MREDDGQDVKRACYGFSFKELPRPSNQAIEAYAGAAIPLSLKGHASIAYLRFSDFAALK
ncbi:MAG TPA: hypothetical protein VHL08_06765 [Dongiaceae bacterium]|jgi:hypothetical protein|nr:hypothetical protein [Dongiaceae bacterium]